MEEFIKNSFENICLEDNRVSLEAKGLYYSILLNKYGGNSNIKDIIKNTNEDKDFVSKLIMELFINDYLVISLNEKMSN